MMQCRLFAGLYHESNVPVVLRPRAMSLEESSPIRSVHVASRSESGEREMTRNKRRALSLRCDGDGEKMSLVIRRRDRVCAVFMKRLICSIVVCHAWFFSNCLNVVK